MVKEARACSDLVSASPVGESEAENKDPAKMTDLKMDLFERHQRC